MAKPIGENLLIRTDPVPESTESGIVLLSELDPASDAKTGTVAAAGNGKIDPDIRIGSRVLYRSKTLLKNGKRYNPNEFEEAGETLVHVHASDVLAIIS